MKIIEARDGFIKFEAEDGIFLSSFVMTEGLEKCYVAQVLQIKQQGLVKLGFAKILYLYDGEFYEYDKTLPAPESELVECTADILKKLINVKTPVIIGKTQNDLNITVDASVFDKKLLVSADGEEENNIIARNISKQAANLGKKTIIIDTLGVINAKKYIAGVDFKLPLDTASLAFLYEDCLNDATSDSKATIIDIFKELSEYSKTVPFLPFGALKSIVDDMVDNSHLFKLLVLKNKLSKFEKLGYFAVKKEQVDSFEQIIGRNSAIIDLSKLNPLFLNRFLSFIYESIKGRDDIQVVLELSNTVSKKNIKTVLTSETPCVCITHSKFKYLNDIKTMFPNYIIAPSAANNAIFKQYSILLRYMEKGTCLITGDSLENIPFVSKLQIIDELPEEYDEVLEEIAQIEEDSSEEEFAQIEEENSEDDIAPKSELFNTIEEKSEEAIAAATEDLQTPENIEMFSEEDNDEEIIEKDELEQIEEVSEDEQFGEIKQVEEVERIEEESKTTEAIIEEDSDDIKLETEVSDNDSEITELELDLSDSVQEAETQKIEPTDEITISDDLIDVQETLKPETTSQDELISVDIDNMDLDLPVESGENSNQELTIEELQDEPKELQPADEISEADTVSQDILDVEPISDDEFGMEEVVELNPDEADENDIVIDMGDSIEEKVDDEIDEQIVQDVDKVFTTMKESDEISDSDLDFIDELNSDDDVILEDVSNDEAVLDELTQEDEPVEDKSFVQESYEIPEEEPETLEVRDSSTPIVPVYDADIPKEDMVMSDPIEQGDNVYHAKYGNGVVEKMIKYGTKTLYSINFENLGRRLLDPTLTEIKKS